jgi:hypothetical protein
MAKTLVLVDETADPPEETGDSATLDDNGVVTYKGDGVKAIIAKWLRDQSPEEAFEDLTGWSNGYSSLREGGQ